MGLLSIQATGIYQTLNEQLEYNGPVFQRKTECASVPSSSPWTGRAGRERPWGPKEQSCPDPEPQAAGVTVPALGGLHGPERRGDLCDRTGKDPRPFAQRDAPGDLALCKSTYV